MIINELTNAVQQVGGAFVLVGFVLGLAVIMALAWARGLASPETVRETGMERLYRAHGHPGRSCRLANCAQSHTWRYP